MGTGGFAVPMLAALCNSRHCVAAVVTRPISTQAKRTEVEHPMLRAARERGLPILQPESVNAPQTLEQLKALDSDLFVVADYGQILSPAALAIPRHGAINLHGSLLPKYRGAAPINWAIYHGEAESGVTVIHMTPKIDAGPCIAKASTPILPDETAAELELRLSELGAPLVCQAVDALQQGDVQPLVQDASLATRAPRLKKTDGAIDWRRSAREVHNQVRAMQPWPTAYTFWHPRQGQPQRLIVDAVDPSAEVPENFTGELSPGTVLCTAGGRLIVATGQGAVEIIRLQPAGKRKMPAAEYLRGHAVLAGDRLGPEI